MNPSSRRVLLSALAEEAQKIRGGAYLVKRGGINWATFDFDSHARAISITQPEGSVYPSQENSNQREGLFTFEAAVKMRNPERRAGGASIEDDLLDELLSDIVEIVRKVSARRDKDDNPIIFRAPQAGASFFEFHDADDGVEGVAATFRILY